MTGGLAEATHQSKRENTTWKLSVHFFNLLLHLFFSPRFSKPGFCGFMYCANLPKKSPNWDILSASQGGADMEEKCDQPQ